MTVGTLEQQSSILVGAREFARQLNERFEFNDRELFRVTYTGHVFVHVVRANAATGEEVEKVFRIRLSDGTINRYKKGRQVGTLASPDWGRIGNCLVNHYG